MEDKEYNILKRIATKILKPDKVYSQDQIELNLMTEYNMSHERANVGFVSIWKAGLIIKQQFCNFVLKELESTDGT